MIYYVQNDCRLQILMSSFLKQAVLMHIINGPLMFPMFLCFRWMETSHPGWRRVLMKSSWSSSGPDPLSTLWVFKYHHPSSCSFSKSAAVRRDKLTQNEIQMEVFAVLSNFLSQFWSTHKAKTKYLHMYLSLKKQFMTVLCKSINRNAT